MEVTSSELKTVVLNKIQDGKSLLHDLHSQFALVDGTKKLERRIRSEIKFLEKLLEGTTEVKKEHILSSNLCSLAAITDILRTCEDPVAVFKPFSLESSKICRIEVDIVSNGGATWHKAIARKAEALDDISKGRSSCGQKSVIDQAKAYLKCAKLHPHLFKAPQVVFHFFNSISSAIASKLQNLGISVEGNIISVDSLSTDSNSDSSSDDTETDDEPQEDERPDSHCLHHIVAENGNIFLDITAMVAYVSSMTNGGAYFRFPRAIYNQQAEWERMSPAKPTLEKLFQRKQLVTCREALVDFQTLVDKMGGPNEKQRTSDLIHRLHVVENSLCGRVANLQLTSNVKERSRLIFNTADRLGIVIVTANIGFVRSAASQGIEIAHHIHEPRVLTEQQESVSVRLATEEVTKNVCPVHEDFSEISCLSDVENKILLNK